MLANLIKTAFRNILRKFGFSLLNILGLTLGIASAIFLVMYVADELSIAQRRPVVYHHRRNGGCAEKFACNIRCPHFPEYFQRNTGELGQFRGFYLPAGNIQYVYIFGLVAFFLVLIASLNYINLSTTRATSRAKEVSLIRIRVGT